MLRTTALTLSIIQIYLGMMAEKLHHAYRTVAKQGSGAIEMNATIEEVLEAVFSAWSMSSH
jgi:hypothetical protein